MYDFEEDKDMLDTDGIFVSEKDAKKNEYMAQFHIIKQKKEHQRIKSIMGRNK